MTRGLFACGSIYKHQDSNCMIDYFTKIMCSMRFKDQIKLAWVFTTNRKLSKWLHNAILYVLTFQMIPLPMQLTQPTIHKKLLPRKFRFFSHLLYQPGLQCYHHLSISSPPHPAIFCSPSIWYFRVYPGPVYATSDKESSHMSASWEQNHSSGLIET